MLTADGTALRIIVDEPRRRVAERHFRIIAIVLTVVAGWGMAWFLACLAAAVVGGGFGDLDGTALLALGSVGFFMSILVAIFAGAMWDVVRTIRRRFPLGAALLAVGPAHVEGPGTGPIPFERVRGATVRWQAVRRAPAVTPGGVLGNRIGRRLMTRAGLDAHRTVALTLDDASVVECLAGPFADDAEFGRVVQALEWELGRRGLTLATAQQG
ncbi:hypothetical protein [Agrococcus sp. ARC_14]|uniref:hypothetical protein n=1 Tax=Agrococcus sp. ARC_14 TaxID=2919927 RepID=UPI001F055B02|nr:hypothetical protein [Agrococcus sp. ARC_14]MCH1883121.1 hypothetical protein [Agrococcus sp. ARC_14]